MCETMCESSVFVFISVCVCVPLLLFVWGLLVIVVSVSVLRATRRLDASASDTFS